jgi:hypothetical protein
MWPVVPATNMFSSPNTMNTVLQHGLKKKKQDSEEPICVQLVRVHVLYDTSVEVECARCVVQIGAEFLLPWL